MRDSISVLTHSTNPMAKTWRSDGTIQPYADGKYFKHKSIEIDNIADLSKWLSKLESKTNSCVIRGSYLGDERAQDLDLEYNKGKVRRIIDVFEDKPHHWMLVEVDNFEPLGADPMVDPVGAIDEYIYASLPECFHCVSYHWQLSNSAGHEKHEGKLKVHVWFWLETAYTSDHLRAWATECNIDLDKSVLNVVQVHYTAAPIFEDGVSDPVEVRSGFVDGLLGDEVALVISDDILSGASSGGSRSKADRLRQLANTDARARLLYERGMVKSVGRSGELRITCPRESVHSGESGESSTVYYLPNTGGYATGHFVCKHAHCHGVAQTVFNDALGYDEFDILTEADNIELDRSIAEGRGSVGGKSDSPKLKNLSFAIPKAEFLTTDLANAKRMMVTFKNRLLFCAGKWYAYNGKFWCNKSSESYLKTTRLSSIIVAEANEWDAKAKSAKSADDAKNFEKVAEGLRKWAVRSEMKGTFEAASAIAAKLLEVPVEQMNSNPHFVNVNNGTVDLRTREVRAHNPLDYMSYCLVDDYTPNARSETFLNVLLQVTREDEDYALTGLAPKAKFLLRWWGYCLTGLTREQVFVIMYGGGRNGKSTVVDIVAHIMGEVAGTCAPGLMTGGGKDRHPTEIADLFGKRMMTAHETGEGAPLREDFVKQATGSDKVKARYMRGDFFEFVPTHKLQVLTNYKPTVKGQDEGIWRRILLVNFNAKFGTQEELSAGEATHIRDLTVPDLLKQETGGILSMLIDAGHEYYINGLNPPDSVKMASLQYKETQDRMKHFIDECCEVGPEFKATLTGDFGGLYPAYVKWCKESGFLPLGKIKVLEEIFRVLPKLEKKEGKENRLDGGRNKVTFIHGIKLINDV